MKTISSREVVEQFDQYSRLAHDGERILVTQGGEPWILLGPPLISALGIPVVKNPEWPDFNARLEQYYPTKNSGPTATELLAEDREDRF